MENQMAIIINLHNLDLADLFVSVLDMNLAGTPVTFNQRINEDVTVQIPVQEDGSGRGNIQWNAQRTDDPEQTALRTVEVTEGATVDVTTHFE
jgi:hypothetical protein